MLAIFDLDKTLIKFDSTTLWSQWLCKHNLVKDKQTYLHQEQMLMQAYEAKNLNITDYVQLTLQPILHLPIQQVDKMIEKFIDDEIKPIIYPQSLSILSEHKNNGDEILIISASAHLLVKPIAHWCFNVSHAFGIPVKTKDGYYTTEISGIIPYQSGKLTQLQHYTSTNKTWFDNTFFYSDSMNDEVLLRAVEFPRVINPDLQLNHLAQSLNWPIYHFK